MSIALNCTGFFQLHGAQTELGFELESALESDLNPTSTKILNRIRNSEGIFISIPL